MEQVIIGANWKMHKTLEQAEHFLKEFLGHLPVLGRCRLFLAASYTHLSRLSRLTAGSTLLLAAQNVHWAESGPYVGEISARMLAEIGVDMVVIGHSQRRDQWGETDQMVNGKLRQSLAHDLQPLVCIGEHLEDKECGVSGEVLARQIKIALRGIDAEMAKRVWIAYEPVWAIGEGATAAQPEYAAEMHALIRATLCDCLGLEAGDSIPILYGGSVFLENAVGILKQPNVNGLFLARSGLESESFIEIIGAVRSAGLA